MTKQAIQIQHWIKQGCMIIAADALSIQHEMHPYNQALRQGVRPEDFGIKNPLHERFKDLTREELMQKILELETELHELYRHGA